MDEGSQGGTLLCLCLTTDILEITNFLVHSILSSCIV